MKIGNKLRRLRLQLGLTQKELADRCELSKSFISLLERDLTSPSLDTLSDLLEALGTVKQAYNLDGGSSSTLVFRKGSAYWAKINGSTGKKRQLKDIIYFADAWLPEE